MKNPARRRARERATIAITELDEEEPTQRDARPGEVLRIVTPFTQDQFESMVVANGQLYTQLRESELEIASLRKELRQLERVRRAAFARGVIEGLKRAKDEALLEFGVSGLRIEALLEELEPR